MGCTWEDTFNENSNHIQGSNHPQASPPRVLSCAICNFVWAKKRFEEGGGSWALSECYSGGGGSKPQDESRSAPPDPRDDGFLQKIVDFLGGKIRGKWGRQSEEILHKLEMR